MIGFLRGVLLQKSPQEVLLDVSGVGYRVLVPISTFCRLGDQGGQAQLLVHTHVREDQLALYGFASSSGITLTATVGPGGTTQPPPPLGTAPATPTNPPAGH